MERLKENRKWDLEEQKPWRINGFIGLALVFIVTALSVLLFVNVVVRLERGDMAVGLGVAGVIFAVVLFTAAMIALAGLRILKPNEALVLTLFGHYHGTLRGEGFYFVIPFVSAVNPAVGQEAATFDEIKDGKKNMKMMASKKMSLKAITLTNNHQKINDALGNPIIIGIVVIWRITNTAKAAFNVENYVDYLSTQTDSALRSIVRLYPYDGFDSDTEKSLQGSSQEVADRIKEEIQRKVDIAGLEVLEARITHLAYAPEIASAMLQRQQARAIIDARAMIVDGAVGMVEMALHELEKSNVVELDEERKAAMVSNLLVVLCGNHDAQPIINSGSLY